MKCDCLWIEDGCYPFGRSAAVAALFSFLTPPFLSLRLCCNASKLRDPCARLICSNVSTLAAD